MRTTSFHLNLAKPSKLSDLTSSLTEACHYEALLEQSRRCLQKRLQPLGLQSPFEFEIPDQQQDVLVSEDGTSCILIRLVSYGDETNSEALVDLLGVSLHAEPVDIPEVVSTAFGLSPSPGSLASAATADRLNDRLGELSPNGRKLADPKIRAATRRLCDDRLRQDLAAVVGAVGANAVTAQFLEGQIETLKGREDSLTALLEDEVIFTKHFIVACNNCGTPHLGFDTRSRAEEVATEAGNRCFTCGQQELVINNSFSVTDEFLRGIQQGLWLEALASDVLSERTETVWTCRMVETNELDVLAVYSDNTVLIKCKDSSFGQNELYVISAKAEDVSADEVIIVSTKDIHPNVPSAAERIGGGTRNYRNFTFISEDTHDAIRDALLLELNRMETEYVRDWLNEGPNPSYMYRRALLRGYRSA